MKNELQIFNFEEKEIRTVLIDKEPWWIAKDVCDYLEHSNVSMALENLDEDEKTILNIQELNNTLSNTYSIISAGNPNLNFINESGLYHLIFNSRKPQAKQFRKWITHEVIPSIRKTGQYSIPQKPKDNPILEIEQNIEKNLWKLKLYPEYISQYKNNGLSITEYFKRLEEKCFLDYKDKKLIK